jgi:hypothetical protein
MLVPREPYHGVSETSAWVTKEDPTPRTVTLIIGRKVAMRFFGCRDEQELRKHLKRLKSEGRLEISPWAGNQHVIRVDATRNGRPCHVLGIVVKGRKADVPTFERPRDPSKGRLIVSGGR